MEYIDLFRELENHKIKYLICGGLAVNIYGIPRMTADIDILLDFTDQNISRFETAIVLLNYQARLPLSLKNFVSKKEREKIKNEKNLIAFSYFNSFSNYMTLDVLMDVPLEFDELWATKENRMVEGIVVNLVSIENLIVLKQYSNRNQDRDDIILLSKLLGK